MRPIRHSKNLSGSKPSPVCRHIQQQMPLFLDGELSVQEARDVANHLAECANCQRERERWQQSERALADAKHFLPVAGDLRAGFHARLAATQRSRRPGLRIDWRIAVPALAACGLAFGWLTAQRPIAPVETPMRDATAAISPPAPQREIARGSNLPNVPAYDLAKKHSLGIERSHHSKSGRNGAKRIQPHAPAVVALNAHRKGSLRLRERLGRQIAQLDSHRNGSSNRGLSGPVRHLSAAPNTLFYEALHSPNVSTGLQLEAETARSKKDNLKTSLADAGDKVQTENNWAMSLQKNKAVLKGESFALGKTANTDKNVHTFGYGAPPTKSDAYGELKEQSVLSAAAKNAFAYTNQSRASSQDVNALNRQNISSYSGSIGQTFAALGLRRLPAGGEDGIDLQVRDSKRGFTSSTRLASQVQEQNGRRVLIIQAEDADISGSGEAQPTSESNITGSSKDGASE